MDRQVETHAGRSVVYPIGKETLCLHSLVALTVTSAVYEFAFFIHRSGQAFMVIRTPVLRRWFVWFAKRYRGLRSEMSSDCTLTHEVLNSFLDNFHMHQQVFFFFVKIKQSSKLTILLYIWVTRQEIHYRRLQNHFCVSQTTLWPNSVLEFCIRIDKTRDVTASVRN